MNDELNRLLTEAMVEAKKDHECNWHVRRDGHRVLAGDAFPGITDHHQWPEEDDWSIVCPTCGFSAYADLNTKLRYPAWLHRFIRGPLSSWQEYCKANGHPTYSRNIEQLCRDLLAGIKHEYSLSEDEGE